MTQWLANISGLSMIWKHGFKHQSSQASGKRKQSVNVSVYSLKSPLSSVDFTIYAPGIGTLSDAVSFPLGRIQHLRTLLQL